MTVRGGKRLVLAALGLVGLAFIANVTRAFLTASGGARHLSEGLPFLFLLVILAILWNRLARLEAEHGPDHVEPPGPYGRKVLVGAAGAAVLLAVAAVVLTR